MRLQQHIHNMEIYQVMDIMSEGYNIDFKDNSNITKKGLRYYFTIDDYAMIGKFDQMSNGSYIFKFGVDEGGGRMSIDLLNLNNISFAKSVMSEVAKILVLFIKQYNPIGVVYSTDRPSREKVYMRLIRILLNNPDVSGYSAMANDKNRDDKNKYIIRWDKELSDIVYRG